MCTQQTHVNACMLTQRGREREREGGRKGESERGREGERGEGEEREKCVCD